MISLPQTSSKLVSRGEIDLVVASQNGIFVLEIKNWSGTLSTDGMYNDLDITPPLVSSLASTTAVATVPFRVDTALCSLLGKDWRTFGGICVQIGS